MSTFVDWIGLGTGILVWLGLALGVSVLVGEVILPLLGTNGALAAVATFLFLSLLVVYLSRRAGRLDDQRARARP
jgi:hypothetical protein